MSDDSGAITLDSVKAVFNTDGIEGVVSQLINGKGGQHVKLEDVKAEFEAHGLSGVFSTFMSGKEPPPDQKPAADKKLDIWGILADKLGFGSVENMISGLLDKFFGGTGMGAMISGFFNNASGAGDVVAQNHIDPPSPTA